jgi:hypothetical protein
MSGLSVSQQGLLSNAARWLEVKIIGELSNTTYNGLVVDDLLIDVSARPIDGAGDSDGNSVGQAGPKAWREGNRGLPSYGIIEFDTFDLAEIERSGLLFGAAMHEILHVMGFGTAWQRPGFQLLRGAGTQDPRFIGPEATKEYNRVFNKTARGVPVEYKAGASRDTHWDEAILGTEIMTPAADRTAPGTHMPVSSITLASLVDLGYEVDYLFADDYSPPRPSRALRSAGPANRAASALHRLTVELDIPMSLAADLAPHLVDASIAGTGRPATRRAALIDNTRAAVALPDPTALRIARAAVLDTWTWEFEHDDLGGDASERLLCEVFESAWNELAERRIHAAVAKLCN